MLKNLYHPFRKAFPRNPACGSIYGLHRRYRFSLMKRLVFIIALPFVLVAAQAQPRSCLRVMPVDELIRGSTLIARVTVQKVSRANSRGAFNQVAILQAKDVIDGNTSLQQINVLSKSTVACANDVYQKNQEMLVFLVPEDSLYSTQNFQYGQFLIVEEVVKGWRDSANNVTDKPYLEVRKEIEDYLKALRNQNQPNPTQPPQPGLVVPQPNAGQPNGQQKPAPPPNGQQKPAPPPPPNGKPPLENISNS